MTLRSQTLVKTLAPIFWFGATLNAAPFIDLDRNGLSDIWEIAFDAQGLDPNADNDNDGATNAQECEHGTDPFDPESVFSFDGISAAEDGVAFTFNGAPNQSYYFEVSDDLVRWEEGPEHVVSQGGTTQLVAENAPGEVVFLRFRIGADQDKDGLTDFEESLLGYDPLSQHSDPQFSGGDSARLVKALTSDESLTINGRVHQGVKPTLEEASRFLHQATLGAVMDDIESVANTGFDTWIQNQFQEEAGIISPAMDWWIDNVDPVFFVHRRYAWWEQVMTSDDLLRQRLAVALGEIYVLSDESLDGGASTTGMADFYDRLLQHSFGNWRDLLRDVSLHPAMGFYLSHLQNRKADPEENRFPDENYAREIMQLFSIGLFELNPDGTRKIDEDGNDIPTYDNTDITNFARIFTGFSYGGDTNDIETPWKFFFGDWVWDEPMKAWIGEHDTDSKTLLRGQVLPAFADDPGRTPMDDFEDAIDNLYYHPNVGPFICYRLIQRLIKSNPSPGYVQRVSQIFDDNGQGVRGDMKSVVTAILLDPEARSLAALDDPHSGRLREPYLRWVRLVKSLGAKSGNGTFLIPDWSHLEEMGQRLMSSPSVFNFFLPDFVATGEMADADLVGPEFQILTATTAMATQNVYGGALMWGFGIWDDESPGDQMHFDLEEEVALLEEGNLQGVIDRLDLLLTYGQLRDDTRQILQDAYDGRAGWFDTRQTVAMLVRIVLLSPEFAIIR